MGGFRAPQTACGESARVSWLLGSRLLVFLEFRDSRSIVEVVTPESELSIQTFSPGPWHEAEPLT